MKIALLNIMPDAALKATDRQFSRLLSVHPDAEFLRFTFPEIERPAPIAQYIGQHYLSQDEVRAEKPDGLIITGTNVSNPRLEGQVFWQPLRETLDWSLAEVCSTLCSCLASHAVMQFRFNQLRTSLPQKVWEIYEHGILDAGHALVQGLPRRVPVPQSRFNQIKPEQFEQAGLQVLMAGSAGGVHLAVNEDHSLVLMQGHPEYDAVSLLKEYKREVIFFHEGRRPDEPPVPEGMVSEDGLKFLEQHADKVRQAMGAKQDFPEFPESATVKFLHESWHPAAARVFENWLGLLQAS